MANWQPLTRDRHGQRHWRRFPNYHFTALHAVVPLAARELPRAAAHLPIAVSDGEDDKPARFVAVLGLQPGENLFVSAEGRWLGGYVPAAFRAYPFVLARTGEDDGQRMLCIDEDSGLLTDPPDGEALFDAQGEPTEVVKQVLEFLRQTDGSVAHAATLTGQLAEHELLQPWPLTAQTDQGTRRIGGLLRIDEARLNALPAEALKALQPSGALLAAYCQLLSMQQIQTLATLARRQLQPAANQGRGLDFLADDDSLSFGEPH